jgi:hypothetical protein
MAYDPKRKVVWMTSGQYRHGDYYPGLVAGGLWAFDPVSRTWSREGPDCVSESTKVSSLIAEYMAYDPVSDGLFVPGPYGAMYYSLQSVAVKDGISNDNWSISGTPATEDPTAGQISFTVDTRRNRAILYLPYLRETWSYDFATRQSRRLSTQALPARSVFGMIYDSANDVVVLFAGYDDFEGSSGADPLNELWVFNLSTNTWSRPTLSGRVPPPRKGESIVYDSYNNVIVQMGGTGGWQSGVDQYGFDGSELFLLRLNLGSSLPPDTTPPAPPTNLVVR